ncbi:hypothetical protein J2X46_001829 [Nocardioides sp. BE266]|uniref:hypothetical protein n=1 Tax=Nocardioides sp. BE266 TaxID=2817725 RepID=UPI0028653133|nr:hypothetical protein [Nocardioides sp. BE266]MDR7252844.1 hypothetical protein [Nocardioides sp. BE266]
MSALPALPEGDELVAAWEEALDAIEQDVRSAAELARDPKATGPAVVPWEPPTPGGPVPEVLVDRVRELLRLQAEVSAGLVRAVDDTRTSLAGLERRAASARRGAASYVDVSA